mgnify:CR=1 FL=1
MRLKTGMSSDLSNNNQKAKNETPPSEKIKRLIENYRKGQYEEAEEQAVLMTQQFPNFMIGWKALGAILAQTGRNPDALFANQKAVALSPQDAENHNSLGFILRKMGKLDLAQKSFSQAIGLNPNFVAAHNNLGITLKELGKLKSAEKRFKLAISIKPDYLNAYNNLGATLEERGRLEEAAEIYKKVITLKPNFAEAYNNLGNTLKALGKIKPAKDCYKKAISLSPDNALAQNNLGLILRELGKSEEAKACYINALKLKPDYVEAHRNLTLIKKFERRDQQYSTMLDLYLNGDISEEQRCQINFGLAKAYDDLKDFEQAFAHFKEGNALRKKLLDYDISEDIALFKQIEYCYPSIARNSLNPETLSKDVLPIFIVGMPRSGTTIVEQIISSHSQVTGAGELSYAAQFGTGIANGFYKVDHEILLDFRHKYLSKLKKVSCGKFVVTDKMPQNFRYIGLLAAAFPEAKIIHVKRNPAAVCWANFTQYFVSKSLGYCYALDDIVSYYDLYINLMKFWTTKLNKRIYSLDYEILTVNQEDETRQLINHLDLDWDENCLSPQNNKRRVATASNLQVREKLYQGSSKQWEKYQPFLKGAFDVLLSP